MKDTKKIKTSRACSRGRCPDGSANPVDIHVGKRISTRRRLLKLSQETLAKYIGLTFQQIQKYEQGANRISASRLWDLSQVLNVDVSYFFQDMPAEIADKSPRMIIPTASHEKNIFLETPLEFTTESQELLRNYQKISFQPAAKAIFDLLSFLAHTSHTGSKI